MRLGAVLALSTVFSVTLAVFTSGSYLEIFSATAAYADVQVVLVGTTSSNGTGAETRKEFERAVKTFVQVLIALFQAAKRGSGGNNQ